MKNKFDGYAIISDLDGTLLNNNKMISLENIEAINCFMNNGGSFSVATGRVVEATEEYLAQIKVNLPIIVYNGGIIFDYNNKKVLFEKFLDMKQKKIIKRVLGDYNNIGIEVYANRKLYVLKDSGHSKRPATEMLDIIYNIDDDIFSADWNKVLIVGDYNIINNIEKTFYNTYGLKGTRSGRTSYEILPLNESKGQALNNIKKMFDLDSKKIICVGDNMNDLELLQEAEFSFCPENSSEELKKYVDFITSSNEEHVIKHIVEWLEQKLGQLEL